jgi:hypothetical protein
MAEIVADAADGRAAVEETVDAAGAADVLVAAAGIVDAAGLAGDDTKLLCHGFTRIHTDIKRPRRESWPFSVRCLENRSWDGRGDLLPIPGLGATT